MARTLRLKRMAPGKYSAWDGRFEISRGSIGSDDEWLIHDNEGKLPDTLTLTGWRSFKEARAELSMYLELMPNPEESKP